MGPGNFFFLCLKLLCLSFSSAPLSLVSYILLSAGVIIIFLSLLHFEKGGIGKKLSLKRTKGTFFLLLLLLFFLSFLSFSFPSLA